MRSEFDFKSVALMMQRGLRGPQMLAFLPALCLAAYWGGGEPLLVFCALVIPLVYALTGLFAPSTQDKQDPGVMRSIDSVAREFLDMAQHHGQTTACFQMGIDGLDEIASQFGDTAADEARKLLATRLSSVLREKDALFPVGDRRFAVLISPGFRLKLDTQLALAKRLRDVAEEPLSLCGTTRFVSVNIGIASSLTFGRNATAERWLTAAVAALDEASATGGTSVTRVWSDKLSKQRQARRDRRQEVLTALDSGQIQAFFQPQVSTRTGEVTGMEALARWDHPTRGWLTPAEFLQDIADGGQMGRLGKSMLRQSLAALQNWDAADFDVPSVSVNLSDIELRNPDLVVHITEELDHHGVPPARLAIEVLETVMTIDMDDVICRNLAGLAELGCRIDLDDFGTGHASITALRRFPIKRVKVDQSFVQGCDRNEDTRRMLTAILSLTEKLGLDAIAEGVEAVAEHGVLRDLGCRFAQGFLFAEPASAADITDWLAAEGVRNRAPDNPRLRRVK
jgi:diguanylate cyclase (GGDEF)-like protein